MTFVNVGYWAPSMDSVLASSSLEPTVTIQSSWGSFSLATIFDFILAQFSKIGITFGNGGIHTAGSIQSDDSVKAQRLCAGNTCVDEAQLQQLLQNASGTFSPSPTPFTEPSPSPSPTPEPSATPDTRYLTVTNAGTYARPMTGESVRGFVSHSWTLVNACKCPVHLRG